MSKSSQSGQFADEGAATTDARPVVAQSVSDVPIDDADTSIVAADVASDTRPPSDGSAAPAGPVGSVQQEGEGKVPKTKKDKGKKNKSKKGKDKKGKSAKKSKTAKKSKKAKHSQKGAKGEHNKTGAKATTKKAAKKSVAEATEAAASGRKDLASVAVRQEEADLKNGWAVPPADALRVAAGFQLADLDRAATPGWERGRKAAEKILESHAAELSDLQERLFADGRAGGHRSVLLVLQGMDTAGKGGIMRHVVGMVDPQGVSHHAFGVPTPEERKHNYLWRIRRALPAPGQIGVFDRSHYEDVLVVRVDSLVPQQVWERRYEEINRFERKIVDGGTTIVKVALMVSPEEQLARLMERLDRPDKNWKFSPNDVAARSKWPAYQEAYQAVFDLTNTPYAPWHIIPADNKWYARLAVSELLLEALRGLDLGWPVPRFDVAAERARLAAT